MSLLCCQFIEKLQRRAPEGQNKAISQGSVNYREYGRNQYSIDHLGNELRRLEINLSLFGN